MIPSYAIHSGYERLIGTAAVDPTVRRALLGNPRATALQFGLSAKDADLAADIHAGDLRCFCTTLLPRLYGKKTAAHAIPRRALAS